MINKDRNICIFTGSGFSCALFGQKTQNNFVDDFIDSSSIYFKYLSDELKYELAKFTNIELLMSHYHNLAYSKLKDNNEGGIYRKRILTLRSAIALYYKSKFKNPFHCFDECYKDLIDKFFDFKRISKENVFFVTTNYDLSIEKILFNKFGAESYYSGDQFFVFKGNYSDKIPVFKLHGSINWFESRGSVRDKKKINSIKPLRIYPEIFDYEFQLHPYNHNKDTLTDIMLSHQATKYTPILIPFFFQKETWLGERWSPLFDSIWNSASAYMLNAEEFYFIGYSLPSADHYIFSYLYKIFKKNLKAKYNIIDRTNDTPLINLIKHICKSNYSTYDKGLIEYLKTLSKN